MTTTPHRLHAMSNLLRAGLFSLALGSLVAPQAYAQTGGGAVAFSSVQVTGNERIEDDTIRVFAGLVPGQGATAADINDAVQRLFQTGLFEDVSITPTGGRLVIAVVENPTINIINFEGNRRLDDDRLNEIIQLSPRDAYSRAAAEADARSIVELYARSGRIAATVVPRIIRLEDNRVNLVYEISEGRVTEVQRIAFVGNETYSDRRLRRVVETSQAGIFSWFFSSDVYDPDRLQADQQALREFYLDRGFIDFEVLSASAELARERNGFFLTFAVSEGQQFRIGRTSVAALAPGLDPADFEEIIDLRPGQVYSAERVDRVIERMAFLAGQQGFAFVEITPRLTRDDAAGTVDIEFELVEGPRVFVERIDIRGNTETLDRVIRRQFRLVEGDAFNAREVRRAEQRIQALRFFGRVETRVREGSAPDRAVITVDVEEAPTGNLQFGAAFSSTEGVTGTVSLTERNFLGRGQLVSIDLATGEDSNTLAFNFNEPALFDQDLSAGFNIYYREYDLDESSINTTTYGLIPRIGFPLTEDSRLSVRLRFSEEEINVDDMGVSPILRRENGKQTTIGGGFTYTLDKRNSPIDPTAGFLLRLDQDFAFFENNQYAKTEALARAYTSVLDEEVVITAEVEGGALVSFNDRSRLTERFTLGGDSFRGFQRGGLGPRDRCVGCGPSGEDINDALGGNLYAVARLEASFPIGLPEEYGIYGGVFADAGTLWDLYDVAGASGTVDDGAKLRSSVGVSLFWDTAIGPLRFNYAKPIKSEDGDEFEEFRITIDTRF
ncbi:outer membrane protein assembly factor BamA [Oceanibium sediminis]|uniref:outer membrane protein assembly factor BamA n=1 Tax=Oceanibium sediminis TaxID=2026339 RepID=UPI001E4A76CA|nr:outer membrane protein assembly factor BamA [Oceanibium sediminis]